MDINTIMFSVMFPVFRNVFGWLENALEDGKIEKYEWTQLGNTLVRILTPVIIVGLGVEFIDADQAITVATSAVATLIDFIWSKVNKNKA